MLRKDLPSKVGRNYRHRFRGDDQNPRTKVSASVANSAAIDVHEEQGMMSFQWRKAECTWRVHKAAAGKLAGAGHAARMQSVLAQ